MIFTPQGEYVFLEISLNGQVDFVAHLAGLPIYECLAAMLPGGWSIVLDKKGKVLHAD